MPSGDGLLARLRPVGGRLSLAQAAAIAEAALECGNGAIGLSSRANLQIRGVGEETLPTLAARLDAAGLLDRNAEVERLRNIVVSPMSDLDPQAAFDLSPCVAALEARLAADARLISLPAKFGFVLDALGRLTVADVDADVRFEAAREESARSFAAFLGGDEGLAARCAAEDVGAAASRLGLAFLALADASREERRMRALVARVGAAKVFAEAKLEAEPRPQSRRRTPLRDVLGGQGLGSAVVVGAAAPFGMMEASRFRALIARAEQAGAESVRLTPWRAFLIAGLEARCAASVVVALAKLGFITHPDEPRLRVAACPGAPACRHAHRPLSDDATRWAVLLPPSDRVILHVSGCAKGCAHHAPAPMMLTATESGYDLGLNGRAGDPPAKRGLSPQAIDALLAGEPAPLFGATGAIG